ncbi:NADP-dependent oxidoreductase [Saccharothrix longispora]|uniref:NADPH:quinone reductase-like Zn-dependent oxidoreductase n=1 Tax=Saccharothrix longispora TaxID=33920 RepID=A0ABU1PSZ8_9PSEU|nr:NADP-dependent oxidoreductase [Saccharothrix longispora]MDR6593778.1 NADPH:quinone reductase-like Zn-dependent oxidoreductase [Saccharothrix longispora]
MSRTRAISQSTLGGPEVLTAITRPTPVPGPTEVLVRVRAAGVNPVDAKTRRTGGRLGEPPFVLGWDVSGVVEAVGEGVTVHRPGDEVFGMPLFPREAGAYAEHVVAPARQFVRKPDALDHPHAAALPLVGLTAWQSLVDTAGLRAGQRVLVHAAAGGVGHVAVQIAKALGAHVTGTASAAKHDFVRGLGADEVVDYTAVDFADVVRDVDVAFDTVGGDVAARSVPVVRDGGIVVTILGPALPAAADAAAGRVRTAAVLCEPDRVGMLALADLVERGLLRTELDTVLPLDQAAGAHELIESGRTRGKIVLLP